MAQFKTLQFPNSARGQSNKVRALELHSSQGWRIVSETIIPGKFDTQKAACLWLSCGPLCGLLAGHKEDIIQVTLERPDGVGQSLPVGPAAVNLPSYDVSRWNALLQFDKEIFGASEEIRPYGQKWVDELAVSYMTLNDKAYLPNIVQNLKSKATAEKEEKTRLADEEEARHKADLARAEERRNAAEAEKLRAQQEREANAVFLGRSAKELVIYGVVALLLIAAVSALIVVDKTPPNVPTRPAPTNSELQGPTSQQATVSPSFDCSRVQSAALKLVCNTPDLANLDQQLASAYRDSLAKSSSPLALRKEERAWIRNRNNSNEDVDGLRAMYQSRIAALKAIVPPSPPEPETVNPVPNNTSSPAPAAIPPASQEDSSPVRPAELSNSPRPQGHWYYCDSSQAYYPAVKFCSQAWRAVDPVSTTTSGGEAQ